MAQKISAAQSELKDSLSGVRWVARENLHFTLKFLGPVAEDKVEPILEAFGPSVGAQPRFLVVAKGVGVFPDLRKPRVLWAGLNGEGLERLAEVVEQALEPLGFPRERRRFRPHLSIGRWRDGRCAPAELARVLESRSSEEFGACWVDQVVLFRSDLKPQGAVYLPLGVIRLKREAN